MINKKYPVLIIMLALCATMLHLSFSNEINDELKGSLLFALSFHSRLINLSNDMKYGSVEAAQKVTYLGMMDRIRALFVRRQLDQDATSVAGAFE